MLQMTAEEVDILRSQIVTSKPGRGGRRTLPYVFTEQGVAMLSTVLKSKRAIEMNIQIMRAFVKLREMISTHRAFARKLAEMEKKYYSQFKVVFDALRSLMAEPEPKEKKIGFIKESRAVYKTSRVKETSRG